MIRGPLRGLGPCECGGALEACKGCGFVVCAGCAPTLCLCPLTDLGLFLAGEDYDLDGLTAELGLFDEDFDIRWFAREGAANP